MSDLDELARALHPQADLPPTGNDGYLVFDRGAQSGPFSEQEIRRRMRVGILTSAAQVWREGMAEWAPIAQLFPPQLLPPLHSPARPTPPSRAVCRRTYRQRVGLRSFVFQIIAVVWTAVMLFASTVIFEPTPTWETEQPRLSEHWQKVFPNIPGYQERYFVLMGGVWLVIALPFTIAAIATIKPEQSA
ncbi:MAG: GYF domain-containing protein [Tepidisphaeraceae bacterium]